MNFLLFAAVTTLALHEISACKFKTGSVYSPKDQFDANKDKAKQWVVNVREDLQGLKMKVTFKEDGMWNGNKITGTLCDENENLEPFKNLLYTSLGVESCDFTEGKYQAEEVNEFSDDVCSKRSKY
ncbi:uncharacterized protein LOC107037054 [Diachasma alloeum]|uniref:uncharacterized protein LOC107037054 n=1 Tax=Diachasma alloeum TaxID=454923 RepID=UPI0007383B48|nr:uncharacterized protein LOC107037054 [Diachasma alloeum]